MNPKINLPTLSFVFVAVCILLGGASKAASTKLTGSGIQFPDGTTQTTSASGVTGKWSSSGFDLYYNSGRVGIGTDTPEGTLHLKTGNEEPARIIVESTDSRYTPNIRFLTKDATHPDPWMIGKSPVSGLLTFFHGSSSSYTFVLGLAYETGNVGIGTLEPTSKLDILGEEDAVVLSRLNQVGTRKWCGVRFDRNYAEKWFIGMDQSTDYLLFRRTASSNDMIIDHTGDLWVAHEARKPGGGSWLNSSDGRLKDIKGEYDRGLAAIVNLKPTKFFYRHSNPRELPTDREYIGFVAQEVQKVFPEAISEGSDGYLDFNMHPVNVAVVNAIKELKAENDSLKTENAMLKKDIEKIKKVLGI